jgi:hypothetical protein
MERCSLMLELDALVERIKSSPSSAEIAKQVMEGTKQYKWVPNIGPQHMAYCSKADVLLYGGEPGGGKSALIEGLAYNCHRRSLIMRRKYSDLDRLIEDTLKIHGSRDGFNGSAPPKLRIGDDRVIDFGGANNIGDEQSWMGRGHDFLGLDEATHFAESQVRFLMGWVRTEVRGQRTRTVLATNPPLTAEGLWITEMFAPWLDPTYPDPAKEGELRWAVMDEDRQKWVDGPGETLVMGKMVKPKSFTYIHASVRDNPYYAMTDYERELDSLPYEIRNILLGGFKTTYKDMPNQVIPTKWVQVAQSKWTSKPPPDVPMCAIGVDCSGGGDDPMVMAARYDGWYAPIVEIPGKEIPMDRSGAHCAGLVVGHRRDKAMVVVDMGGGYGGPTYEHLKANDVEVYGYRGAEGSNRRSSDGKLHFNNKRSAAYWAFREALDPGQPGGSPISLPQDSKLLADLTAATFEPSPQGIKIESKENVCKRLGRSTDRGDAIVMAWFQGPKETTAALEWLDAKMRKVAHPKVVLGAHQPLSARRYG